ncbi:oligosaccharide flippase family protein [Pseudomonas sp. 8BK]|uniref:oligosaccharide flippase family protein n=1 Tax=Pseudomonas sp. 8BK TaxID=2653164 RepID=UPI001356A030|nr:oligosaccharide flippase family protein [Pseudomonas sp. 8BK]
MTFLVWLACFLYSIAVGLVLQKLVLPMMPDMHAGHGLMRDDAIYFHDTAVAMAERIRALGWSEWRLMPSGSATGNVGLLAGLYALLGPEPAFFLPLTSAFHAMGAVLVLLIAMQILPSRGGLCAGLVAGFFFLVFPSALVWFGQNHKDSFVIAGFLLALLSFLKCLESSGWCRLLLSSVLFVLGLGLVAIMRPHLVLIYLVAFFCAFICLFLVSLAWREMRCWRGVGRIFWLICLGMLLMTVVPSNNALVDTVVPPGNQDVRDVEGGFLGGWQWQQSDYFPVKLDSLLNKVSAMRAHFINYGYAVEAGSIVDGDIKPQSSSQAIGYLPRALIVGLFAPFPDFWVQKLSMPRIIGALETLMFYLFFPGVLFILRHRISRPLLVCLIVAGAVLVVNAFVSPNMGTLHRVRYGQWFVFLLIGACGWSILSGRLISRFGAPGAEAASASNAAGQGGATLSASRAAGAGVLVMLVSLVGFFGLLVRDLLLIDRVGFGASLDSYYLAIMLPTFFTGLLSMPLGDALSTRMSRLADRLQIQRLLAGATSFTLLLFILVSAILLLYAKDIFSVFSPNGDVRLTMQLFPVALLLLILSGAIVVGNSVMNSRGRPVMAAAAQLVVPLVVVAFVLAAGEKDIVGAAMTGMAVGQLVNLVLLALFLKHYGFNLLPGSLRVLSEEGAMLHNCKWLVLCALLTGAAVPMNYWFAGQIGVGALSTWALGSKLVQISSLLGAALMTAVFVPYMSKVVVLGLKARVRDDLFVSLVVGGWGSAIAIAAVFVFAEPIVYAAASGLDDPRAADRLVGILKFGALQLPFALSAMLLFKLCAVSAVSLRAAIAALVGLIANIVLNILLVPVMGLVGLALAWTISSLVATLVVIGVTRTHSHLAAIDILMLLATWGMLVGLAAAIHFRSWSAGAVVLLSATFLLVIQLRMLSRQRLLVAL